MTCKETGKWDPYSAEGKSSQQKLTPSGPRYCFGHTKTFSCCTLKDKRKWCLKIKRKYNNTNSTNKISV